MSLVIKRIKNVSYQDGGEEHTGWLPAGAAKPLPTPVRLFVLDLTIEQVDGGCLLIYESRDDLLASDWWYDSIEQALEGAAGMFGVLPSQWQDAV
ncbi:hypothetical protein AYO47_03385 [Planctomyces sp. SCGC AG-212-M04]|nr:hypothetical protein AYO47_03385 [Planctomyces sp. SCGC AG-212-M04]